MIQDSAIANDREYAAEKFLSIHRVRNEKVLLRRNEFYYVAGFFLMVAAMYIHPLLSRGPVGSTSFCAFKRITGIPCLMCGMTRSFVASAHLRFAEAFEYHFMGPPFLAVLAICFVIAFYLLITGQRLEKQISDKARRTFWIFLFVSFFTAWVLKIVLYGNNV